MAASRIGLTALLLAALTAGARAEMGVLVLSSHFESFVSGRLEGFTQDQSHSASGALWSHDLITGLAAATSSWISLEQVVSVPPVHASVLPRAAVSSGGSGMQFSVGVDGMEFGSEAPVRRGLAQVSTSSAFRIQDGPVQFTFSGQGFGGDRASLEALLIDQTDAVTLLNESLESNFGQTWQFTLLPNHTYLFQTFSECLVQSGGDPFTAYSLQFDAAVFVVPAPGALGLGLIGLAVAAVARKLPRRKTSA